LAARETPSRSGRHAPASSFRGARDGQKPQLRLWLRMLSITKMLSQEIRRRLRVEFEATLPQFDLLARERDGRTLGELLRRTMVTNGNIIGLIDRFEANGLIAREPRTAIDA
jgi:DNA-binding MarR family transcriptional regulator